MAARRQPGMGSTEDMGLGDNLFTRPRRQPVPGATAGPGPGQDQPGGMPGSPGNPNTGVAGGQGPQVPQISQQLPQVPIVGQGTGQPQGQPDVTQKKYAPIQGFDFDKITGAKPYDSAYKYSDALRGFSSYLGGGGQVSRNNLGGAVDYAKSNGFANARAEGDDKIDFGDGVGPVDVITSNGQIWFNNMDTGMPGASPEVARRTPPIMNSTAPTGQTSAEMPSTGNLPQVDRSNQGASGEMSPQEAAAAGLGWVPPNHPLYGTPGFVGSSPAAQAPGQPQMAPRPAGGGMPNPNTAPGGDPAPGGGQEGPQDPSNSRKQIDDILQGFLSGNLNQGIVDRRVDNARDTLNKQRTSSSDTLGASLAERGQLGSGAGESAQVRLEQALGDDFAGEVNDIYANEAENADNRLAQALSTSAGLSIADAQNMIEKFKAQTGRIDVEGNIALGNKNSDRDYELGQGDLDVRRKQTDNQGRSIDNDFALGNRGIDADLDLGHRKIDSDSQLGNRRIDVDEALGTRGQDLDWSKFLGSLGLDRDRLGLDSSNADWDHILEILRQQGGATNTSANGYF